MSELSMEPTGQPLSTLTQLWADEVEKMRVHKKGTHGTTSANNYTRGLRKSVDWLASQGFGPTDPQAQSDDFFAKFKAHAETLSGSKITTQIAVGALKALTTGEYVNARPRRTAPIAPVESTDEEFDETNEGDEPEENEPQAPAPRAPAQQQQWAAIPIAQMPRQPRQQSRQAAPSRTPADPFRQAMDPQAFQRFSVHKRGLGGKLIYVNEYSLKDLAGSPLARFIKDAVDPQYKDPSGMTSYQIFKIDSKTGTELHPPMEITVESEPLTQPDDDVTKARTAIDMLSELRQMEGERAGQMNEVLEVAKKKAAEGGSMSEMMLLMMMSKFMDGGGSKSDEAVLKILDRIGSKPAPMEWPAMPAPVAPMQSELAPIVAKLLEVQIAPKVEKTLVDSLKEMAMLKELFGPREDATQKAILETLTKLMDKFSTPPQVSSIETALASFTKVKEMVTTLAPAINMGGLTSVLTSVLTPSLAQAVGNAIAKGVAPMVAPQAPRPQLAQPQLPPPPPTPLAPPASAAPHAQALSKATDEQTAIAATLNIMQSLYMAPEWGAAVAPYVQAFTQGNHAKVGEFVLSIVNSIRPDLATQDFVNKIVDAAFKQVYEQLGQPVPARLNPVAEQVVAQQLNTPPVAVPAPVEVVTFPKPEVRVEVPSAPPEKVSA